MSCHTSRKFKYDESVAEGFRGGVYLSLSGNIILCHVEIFEERSCYFCQLKTLILVQDCNIELETGVGVSVTTIVI